MGLTAGTQQEHRYQLCRDEYCDRFPCRIYKEGYRDGYGDRVSPRLRRPGYADGVRRGLRRWPGPDAAE